MGCIIGSGLDVDGLIHDRSSTETGTWQKRRGQMQSEATVSTKLMHPQTNAKNRDKAPGLSGQVKPIDGCQ